MPQRAGFALPERVAARIEVDDRGCWLWTGAKAANGYGSVGYAGRVHSTHRLVYTLLVGEVPDGLQLDHLCQVRACCNPAHLEPVTPSENLRRARAHITHCPQGHEYTPENTKRRGLAQRSCRECDRATTRRWRQAQRALATTP